MVNLDGLKDIYCEVLFDEDGIPKISLNRLKELVEADLSNKITISKYKIGQKILYIVYDMDGKAQYIVGKYEPSITEAFYGEENEGWFVNEADAKRVIDEHNSDPEKIASHIWNWNDEDIK